MQPLTGALRSAGPVWCWRTDDHDFGQASELIALTMAPQNQRRSPHGRRWNQLAFAKRQSTEVHYGLSHDKLLRRWYRRTVSGRPGCRTSNGVLPTGQKYHFSGPTEGGWLVVAVWDSKGSYDHFMSEILMPALSQVSGGFTGIPQRRDVEDVNIASASL